MQLEPLCIPAQGVSTSACRQLHFPVILADHFGHCCSSIHCGGTEGLTWRDKQLLTDAFFVSIASSLGVLSLGGERSVIHQTVRLVFQPCREQLSCTVCRSICNSTAVRLHAALCIADAPSSTNRVTTSRLSQVTAGPNGSAVGLVSDSTASAAVAEAQISAFKLKRGTRFSLKFSNPHCLVGSTIFKDVPGNTHHKVTSLTVSVVPGSPCRGTERQEAKLVGFMGRTPFVFPQFSFFLSGFLGLYPGCLLFSSWVFSLSVFPPLLALIAHTRIFPILALWPTVTMTRFPLPLLS